MSELSQLSKYIVDLQLKDVPEKVQQATVLHVLDTVGTALGASSRNRSGGFLNLGLSAMIPEVFMYGDRIAKRE